MLPKRENRRHQRVSYVGAVRISWEDARGLPKYAKAKCLDVSAEGMRIELTEPIAKTLPARGPDQFWRFRVGKARRIPWMQIRSRFESESSPGTKMGLMRID